MSPVISEGRPPFQKFSRPWRTDVLELSLTNLPAESLKSWFANWSPRKFVFGSDTNVAQLPLTNCRTRPFPPLCFQENSTQPSVYRAPRRRTTGNFPGKLAKSQFSNVKPRSAATTPVCCIHFDASDAAWDSRMILINYRGKTGRNLVPLCCLEIYRLFDVPAHLLLEKLYVLNIFHWKVCSINVNFAIQWYKVTLILLV